MRPVWIALCFAPLALAQSDGGATPPVAPRQPDALDKIMNMIEPAQPARLTPRERFHEYVLSVVGPVPLLGEAAGAGLSQWADSPEEWGQGWGAYGKRLWSNLAYNGIRQTITYGASSTFHEDDRYFVSGRPGLWPRIRHALVSTVTARHPDGRETFSISTVAGIGGASAIASTWGPESWKGPKNIAANAGISFASTAALNVVREFLPDILRRPRP